jgi:thioredoxin reductase (NADPH)
MSKILDVAFPSLTSTEISLVRSLAKACDYEDGQEVFHAGQAEIDLVIVESGEVEIRNPRDGDRVVTVHKPGQFAGDIDILTGRPVIVTAVARGKTRVLCIPNSQIRSLLNRVPSFGEKLITAFISRRELLAEAGVFGLRVIGSVRCRDTNVVREFLHKNFVPFTWVDSEAEEGRALLGSGKVTPVIECSDGQRLFNPSLQALASAAGIWRHCPSQNVDFAIVGAGPAGMAAGVYAASEGLSTLMLDRLGPGGQAGGSSRIENFIGFPAGLSGTELATRGVLQMLKFGARIVAPVEVEKLIPAKSADDLHAIKLNCGAEIHCRVILLALGVRWRRLAASGAERFTGAGIYYACTTVEADIYHGADVAVVGAGNSAGQAAMFLADCCPNRNVHLLVRNSLGASMSDYLTSRVHATKNVVLHEHTEIESVCGSPLLSEIVLRNNVNGLPSRLPCAAVFVFIGAEPAADWLPAELARDANGYLLTGSEVVRSGAWPLAERDPCPLETSVPGVLAAGDIRSGSTKRVGFAVGDGSLAVTCAHRLLSIDR